MNKFNYSLWIGFNLIAYLQMATGLTLADAIQTINGKRTLTASYCNNFGTATELNAKHKSLDVIQSYALRNCTEITLISFVGNQIKELHSDMFKFNRKIQGLWLHCNKLSFLPNEIFKPLFNLEILSLGGNPLGTIEPVLKGGLLRLWKLEIEVVELPELDPTILKQNLPKLEKIWLPGNLIECRAYESIKAKLEIFGILTYQNPHRCTNMIKKCFSFEEKAAIIQKQKDDHLILQHFNVISNNFTQIRNEQQQIDSRITHRINLQHSNIMDLKTNHDDLLRNISYHLTNLRNLSEEKVKIVWITLTLVFVFFILITGFLCI